METKQTFTVARSARTARRVQGFVNLAVAVAGAGTLVAILWQLINSDATHGVWMGQAMLALVMGGGAWWNVRFRRRAWDVSVAKLTEVIHEIRDSKAPVESLEDFSDSMIKPLVTPVQELLLEIKRQQLTIAELQSEMRQRVAMRTDALERVIGSLRHQATRDALTGLFNRRFMDDYLPQAVRRSLETRTDLCLLMIDVDNFKPLNDTLGHAAGDEVLKSIGQLIRSTIRGEDVAFRLGGDEFMVLMPNTSADAGRQLGDRLISLVDALARTLRVAAPPRLSIGVSSVGQLADPTPSVLLGEADRALYAVKAIRHSAADAPPRRRAGAA